MTSPKETNKVPIITDPKEMEIYELSDKEHRTILFKKFSGLQEHPDKQLNKIRRTMHEQNKKFNKEKETIRKTINIQKQKTNKKTETEILELQNTITELKNSIESFKADLTKKKKVSVTKKLESKSTKL